MSQPLSRGHRPRRDRRRRDDRHARARRVPDQRAQDLRVAGRCRARLQLHLPRARGGRAPLPLGALRQPGVEIVGDWDPLGMRGTDSRTLVFTDAFVSADDELLPTGLFDQLAARWPHVYLTLTPTYIGLTRAVVDFVQGFLGQHPAARRSRTARRCPQAVGVGRDPDRLGAQPLALGMRRRGGPDSTRRPSSCGARGRRRTRRWRRRQRWPRSRSAHAAAAR